MTRKNKITIIVLMAVVAVMIFGTLFALKGADFGGSDDAGSEMVSEVQGGNYQPWATPVLEKIIGGEIPGEVETLLFCIQTFIGTAIVFFFLGRFVERKKLEKEDRDLDGHKVEAGTKTE